MAENEKDAGSKILSLVTHKLRTPLSIINGYAEAVVMQLEKEKVSPFTAKAIEEIVKQGAKMGALVDKLLNFAKVDDMKESELNTVSFPLKPLVYEAAEEVLSANEENSAPVVKNSAGLSAGNIAVEITCPDDLSLFADRELFKTVLFELIDNAVKFNNKLEKVIQVYCFKHSTYTAVSIKDTGVGIRAQDVNNIFEKFFQVDDFFTGQIEGWGLGLALAKRIMDMHGGSISVVSDKGVGSVFTLNIPD